MTFPESAGRMTDSIFARGGEDASWRPGGTGAAIACKVLRTQPDAVDSFSQARAILPTALLRVRRSEVANAAAGDTVAVLDSAGAVMETLKLVAEPLLDKYRLVWICECASM